MKKYTQSILLIILIYNVILISSFGHLSSNVLAPLSNKATLLDIEKLAEKMKPTDEQNFSLEGVLKFKGRLIPAMISKEHDHLYIWIKKLIERGILRNDAALINFDNHSDSAQTIKLMISSWAYKLMTDKIIQGPRIWLGLKDSHDGHNPRAVYHNIIKVQDVDFLDLQDSLPIVDEMLSGSQVIITIDFDFIAPFEKGDSYNSPEAIQKRVNRIIDFLEKSALNVVAIHFVSSDNPDFDDVGGDIYYYMSRRLTRFISNLFNKYFNQEKADKNVQRIKRNRSTTNTSS